jgi:hypothetical protein
LIFSTELGRSAKENIKDPFKLRQQITMLFEELAAAPPAAKPGVQDRIDDVLAQLERSVAVYGLVNLRTDGRKVVLAQKLERPRSSTREEFDVHQLERDANGVLSYVP